MTDAELAELLSQLPYDDMSEEDYVRDLQRKYALPDPGEDAVLVVPQGWRGREVWRSRDALPSGCDDCGNAFAADDEVVFDDDRAVHRRGCP